MSVIGHGIDIVEIARIEKLLAAPEKDFIEGVFSESEQQLAPAPHACGRHFAGRLAAKEAVVKALGTGFSQGIAWGEVEIGQGESGAPTVVLSGRAREVAATLGVTRWYLSISHSAAYAVASAIALDDRLKLARDAC
jgi:holo-[acyl-carrier protein] synthase